MDGNNKATFPLKSKKEAAADIVGEIIKKVHA
jgi:hypothetical protein